MHAVLNKRLLLHKNKTVLRISLKRLAEQFREWTIVTVAYLTVTTKMIKTVLYASIVFQTKTPVTLG